MDVRSDSCAIIPTSSTSTTPAKPSLAVARPSSWSSSRAGRSAGRGDGASDGTSASKHFRFQIISDFRLGARIGRSSPLSFIGGLTPFLCTCKRRSAKRRPASRAADGQFNSPSMNGAGKTAMARLRSCSIVRVQELRSPPSAIDEFSPDSSIRTVARGVPQPLVWPFIRQRTSPLRRAAGTPPPGARTLQDVPRASMLRSGSWPSNGINRSIDTT